VHLIKGVSLLDEYHALRAASLDFYEGELPGLDTFRTLLLAPPPEVRDILLAVNGFGLVA
jgi:hypothetical protein